MLTKRKANSIFLDDDDVPTASAAECSPPPAKLPKCRKTMRAIPPGSAGSKTRATVKSDGLKKNIAFRSPSVEEDDAPMAMGISLLDKALAARTPGQEVSSQPMSSRSDMDNACNNKPPATKCQGSESTTPRSILKTSNTNVLANANAGTNASSYFTSNENLYTSWSATKVESSPPTQPLPVANFAPEPVTYATSPKAKAVTAVKTLPRPPSPPATPPAYTLEQTPEPPLQPALPVYTLQQSPSETYRPQQQIVQQAPIHHQAPAPAPAPEPPRQPTKPETNRELLTRILSFETDSDFAQLTPKQILRLASHCESLQLFVDNMGNKIFEPRRSLTPTPAPQVAPAPHTIVPYVRGAPLTTSTYTVQTSSTVTPQMTQAQLPMMPQTLQAPPPIVPQPIQAQPSVAPRAVQTDHTAPTVSAVEPQVQPSIAQPIVETAPPMERPVSLQVPPTSSLQVKAEPNTATQVFSEVTAAVPLLLAELDATETCKPSPVAPARAPVTPDDQSEAIDQLIRTASKQSQPSEKLQPESFRNAKAQQPPTSDVTSNINETPAAVIKEESPTTFSSGEIRGPSELHRTNAPIHKAPARMKSEATRSRTPPSSSPPRRSRVPLSPQRNPDRCLKREVKQMQINITFGIASAMKIFPKYKAESFFTSVIPVDDVEVLLASLDLYSLRDIMPTPKKYNPQEFERALGRLPFDSRKVGYIPTRDIRIWYDERRREVEITGFYAYRGKRRAGIMALEERIERR